jgi:tRNA-uridine 2-sulfurtransferase
MARVIVGMSGGVDSSVAAALLAEQGYDVVGVTMRLWTEHDPDAPTGRRQCCGVEDIADARAVAQRLGIPHYILNLERQFNTSVVDYFVDEYAQGRTPNPCLACNEHIKFAALLDRALAFDANFFATGHYARRVEAADGTVRLLRAADADKDQSYVLYTLSQAQLRRTLFPLGDCDKAAVRALAARFGLHEVMAKPDSVDICFVPGGDYRAFVAARSVARPGAIVDPSGKVVGQHGGLFNYTVGQRKGLPAFGERRFVTAMRPDENLLVVGPEDDLLATTLHATDLRWTAGAPPDLAEPLDVKIRYRNAPLPARVALKADGAATVTFARPQRAVTPGQAAVFYRGDEVLGGGRICAAPAA